MPPNVLSATYTHDAPVRNRPSPKANPLPAAARGVAASCHIANRNATVTTGRNERPNGAKPNTVSAPAPSAASDENAHENAHETARVPPAARVARPSSCHGSLTISART